MSRLRLFLASTLLLTAVAFAASAAKPAAAPQTAISSTASSDNASPELRQKWMVEGEKRYRTNCIRCHQAPHKFAPRIMASAIRHMRVRAMLSQEDTDYITYYLTH